MVVAPGEECTLRMGSGGRAENDWFGIVRDKGREREWGELAVGLGSAQTPGVVLIVSWQLLTGTVRTVESIVLNEGRKKGKEGGYLFNTRSYRNKTVTPIYC
jgi:hypothetical protein